MSTSNNDTTSEEAAVRDLVENWASAVRATDFDGILANHAPDMLMFDVPPPVQRKGIKDYKKSWDLFFSWARDSGVFDIEEMNITAGHDVAFVTALMRCAGIEAGWADKTPRGPGRRSVSWRCLYAGLHLFLPTYGYL
jgi:ketosteroid isomerase-like protein